ncbi:MAG: hypothetical protein LBJ87_05525, partial [bacterium]|nr:hypothetical protein [bacterium]
ISFGGTEREVRWVLNGETFATGALVGGDPGSITTRPHVISLEGPPLIAGMAVFPRVLTDAEVRDLLGPPLAPSVGAAKVWDGSAWAPARVGAWTGSEWRGAKVWDGERWLEL